MNPVTTLKCGACNLDIQNEQDAILCTGACKRNYHYYCGGFGEKTFRMTRDRISKWKCIKCDDQPTVAKQNSPLSTNLLIEENTVLSPESTIEKVPQPIQKSPSNLLNLNSHEVISENQDLKAFITEQFNAYTKNLEYHNDIVKELTTSINQLKQEVQDLKQQNADVKTENKVLKDEIVNLKSEMLELQQYSRRTNLEISGLPEVENEDISEVVSTVLASLQVDNFKNIEALHRVPTSRKDRHKSIIVQFNTKSERDRCIAAAKKKHLLASDVNSRFNTSPIFINEHLAPGMKKLLFLCKSYKKDNNMKFCWVRDGKIFLRKEETSRVIRIRHENDLQNVSSA